MTVHSAGVVIAPLSELNGCNILQTEYCTVAFCADDHIFIVGHILVASTVLKYVSECVFRFCTKGSGRGLKVLF